MKKQNTWEKNFFNKENITKNLNKDWYSFHYNLLHIEKLLKEESKEFYNLLKFLIVIIILLILADIFKIFSLNITIILGIFVSYVLFKILSIDHYNFTKRLENIENYIKKNRN